MPWFPDWSMPCASVPELRDVASDQQDQGLQASLVIDRDTASRLGITPQLIDDTLYDAFGQRQISTMFTQLNQYRVMLEVKPEFKQNPANCSDIYIRSAAGGTGAVGRDYADSENRTGPLVDQPSGAVPGGDAFV